MIMNNVYVYGCSFSYGSHIYQHGYFEDGQFWQDKFNYHWWGYQVADYFGGTARNRAKAGGANETSLFNILHDSRTFGKDDIVIIGITQPDRVSLQPYRKHHYPKDGNDLNRGIVNTYFNYYKENKLYKNMIKGITCLVGEKTDEELDILMHYHQIYRDGDENKKILSLFHEFQFQLLGNLISRVGPKVILWDYTLWRHFETITAWLENRNNVNQRKKDNHWSPNGNTAFASMIIDAIETDKFYLTEADAYNHKDKIVHRYIDKLLPYQDGNFDEPIYNKEKIGGSE